MKKLITRLVALIAVILISPMTIFAQPPGEGWTKLENLIIPNYRKNDTYGRNKKIVAGYDGGDVDLMKKQFATKIAINEKNIDKKAPKSGMRLYTLQGWDNEGMPIFGGGLWSLDSDSYEISNDFSEIILNGKEKYNKNNLKREGDWIILEFDEPAFIRHIYPFKNNTMNKATIMNDVYVYLDPEKDPREKVKQYREAENKRIAEEKKAREEKERQELLSRIYTTPQEKGWSPIKKETLKDGTMVEHYEEGIRFIRKSNGDFASFIEPEGKRDPKTLDMIEGYDLPIDSTAILVGDFQITFANGVVGTKTSFNEEYKTTSGEILKINPIYNNNEELLQIKKPASYIPPFFIHNYKNFINPYSSPDEFFVGETDISIYTFDKKNTPAKDLIIIKPGNGGEDIPISVYIDKNKKTPVLTKPYQENSDVLYIYRFDNKGLEQIAVKLFPDQGEKLLLPVNTKLKEVNNGKYVFENGDFINYEIGDKYNGRGRTGGSPVAFYGDSKITLIDGTTIEKIEDKYRIIKSDGSKYVGTMGPIGDHMLTDIMAYVERGNKNFRDGFFTYANGKEVEYSNYKNITEPELEEDRMSPEKKALIKKYGEDYVFSAQMGIIKVGMPLELIRKFWSPTYDGGSSGSDAYTLRTNWGGFGEGNHWYFHVNKKTGKVTSVTKLN